MPLRSVTYLGGRDSWPNHLLSDSSAASRLRSRKRALTFTTEDR